MKSGQLYLGLPAWGFPGWANRYFSDKPSQLASYAEVFNTVEGNTTFYRTPDDATIARWRAAVDGKDFRFCFKLPREVTHEGRTNEAALNNFLTVTAPMAPHIGPLLVQFPAEVGPQQIHKIAGILARLGDDYQAAVEVRHPAFFENPEALNQLLLDHRASRVSLDARALHLGDKTHPEVLAALHKKPDLPLLPDVIGQQAFIRLVLHPDLSSNDGYLDEWVHRAAHFLRHGIDTWMMIHCPNNLHCPPLAKDFFDRLQTMMDIGALTDWPVPQQLSLV